jgi:hypothetical protein
MSDESSIVQIPPADDLDIIEEVPLAKTISTKKAIRERNQNKVRSNMSRISKYIHIIIFEFLEAKEIFKVSMISRSL